MTTLPPDKQPAVETLENQTQKCADCGGTGKTDGYCGCPNLRSCPYCQGTGQVLTFAAREARRRRTELRYTQNDMDDALRNERERGAKVADAVEAEWIARARNVARVDDLVGGLAQSAYNDKAEIANGIARAIREGKCNE